MDIDSLKTNSPEVGSAVDTTHPRDTSGTDSLFFRESVVFFEKIPSPSIRSFNQDSILRSRANASLENLSSKAISLKGIAVGGNTNNAKPDYRPSHFRGHLLQPVHSGPVPRIEDHQNWQVVLILGVLFSIASLRLAYPKRFAMLWNAFRLKRFANQLFREENVLTQRISILLFVIFLLSGSYYIFSTQDFWGFYQAREHPLQVFAKVLLLFSLFILSKFLIHSIFGFIFKTQKEMAEYLFNVSVIQQISGLGLFVLMILHILGTGIPDEILLWSGGIAFLGMFAFQSYRGFSSALGTVSPVYFFLYFCALEILPLIWILKILRG